MFILGIYYLHRFRCMIDHFWVIESGIHYGLPYPFHEFETGRNLRLSPIYPTLRDKGAVFGQVMGYERPTWFESVGQYL